MRNLNILLGLIMGDKVTDMVEGIGTTFQKTEAILANAPTTTKTEEVLFVINMKWAWQFLLDNLEYNHLIMLLREYDKIVGELLFHYAGEIRTIPVQLVGHLGNLRCHIQGLLWRC